MRSPGAGSFALAETQRVRSIAAIPSNETYLMMDTCAGASIFPRGFDQNAADDSTVAPVRLSTATDDPVNGDAGKKSCFDLRDGRKFQVRYNEADVSFPIVSIGEASHQGKWFVFGPGCQAMLPGSSGEYLRTCVKDPNAAKLEKHRGVYWLPCSATEHTDGVPLCPNPRAARLAVEAPPISVPDPDATPMQLEESEETRRPKHRALPANVSKEEFDVHQLTHLPFRSWCDHCVKGKAVDDAHRPRIDPHRGEAKMGMDYFFLARATDPQHAKAVLNCLDFQSGAVFSAMVVKGGDPYALAVALVKVHRQDQADHHERSGECGHELSGFDQGQQNARDCCDQHAEGIECKCRRNRESKLRGRETDQNTEITAIFGAALCVADDALSGEVRWKDSIRKTSWTTVPRTGGRVC